jgi:hypothetical protein
VATSLAPTFTVVLILGVAWGAGEGLSGVAEQNIFQRRTPDAVRSRVLGAGEGLWHGTLTVAYVVAAFVLPVVGPRGMYAILGASAALSVIVLLPLLGRADTAAGEAVSQIDGVATRDGAP